LTTGSAINLLNGGVLDVIASLERRSLYVGPIVLDECGTDRNHIEGLLSGGRIARIDDELIPASAYLLALETFGLGPGETECIVFAAASGAHVCSDDRAARRVVLSQFGQPRLTGTIGLLKEATKANLISADDAWAAYQLMLSRGAYLPTVGPDDFCA
jgi:predicted nucleic acid-binding protein